MDAQPIPPRTQLTKKPLRIGLATTPFMAHIDCDPENARIAEETALLLEGLGHSVEKVQPPRYDLVDVEWDYGYPAGPAFASMARSADRYNKLAGRELGDEDFSPTINFAFEMGRAYTARQVEEFGEVMSRYVLEWDNWWISSGIDVLLSPTTAGGTPTMRECLPPPLGDFVIPADNPLAMTMMLMPLIPFTQAINWSGQPAVSLPIYTGANGLPVGSHLAAPRMRDDLLFQLMYEIEEAVPWNNGLRPAVSA
jgi:Asp-tRNA(Asn)/Glu-tRNA(Gln) amidotransferase A subunit family amidase